MEKEKAYHAMFGYKPKRKHKPKAVFNKSGVRVLPVKALQRKFEKRRIP